LNDALYFIEILTVILRINRKIVLMKVSGLTMEKVTERDGENIISVIYDQIMDSARWTRSIACIMQKTNI
jgi:hypothetical protein